MRKLLFMLALISILANNITAAESFVYNSTLVNCLNTVTVNTSDLAYLKGTGGSSAMTDDNFTTLYNFTVPAGGNNASPAIDLGSLYTSINLINISIRAGGNVDHAVFETSIDSTTWYAFSNDTSTNVNSTRFTYPYQARYVRIRFFDSDAPTGGGWGAVAELKVYSKQESCVIVNPTQIYDGNTIRATTFQMKSTSNIYNYGTWVSDTLGIKDITFTVGTTYSLGGTAGSVFYINPIIGAASIPLQTEYAAHPKVLNNAIYFAYCKYRNNDPQNLGYSLVLSKYDTNTALISTVTSADGATSGTYTTTDCSIAMSSNENTSVVGGTTNTLAFYLGVYNNLGKSLNGKYYANSTATTTANATPGTGYTIVTSIDSLYHNDGIPAGNNDNFTIIFYGSSPNVIKGATYSSSGALLKFENLISSAGNNYNGKGFKNRSKLIYTTTDNSQEDTYVANYDGSSPVMISSSTYPQAVRNIKQTQQGSVWVTYYKNADTIHYKDVFCGTSATPTYGTACSCSTGYQFDGNSCVYTGLLNTSANSSDIVELYVRNNCEANYLTSEVPGAQYNCPSAEFSDVLNRDYVQVRYYINGQNAYTLTNGSAYCTGQDLTGNTFNFVWKNGSTQQFWEKDVNYDLGDTNSPTFCPSFNPILNQVCLRGQTLSIKCFTNSSSLIDDDVQAYFVVKGTTQHMKESTTQTGVKGTYGVEVPLTSPSFDVRKYFKYDSKTGNLICNYYDGYLAGQGTANIVGTFADVMSKNIGSIDDTFTYTRSGYPYTIGDNRFTLRCSQGSYTNIDPIEVKTEINKFRVINICNTTAVAKISNIYFVSPQGSFLNSSFENTQLTIKDYPKIRFTYSYYDNGNEIAEASPDTVCSYTVINVTTGATIKGPINVPYTGNYYTNFIYGPNSDSSWPSPSPLTYSNYTVILSCTNAQCKGNANGLKQFALMDTQCTGQPDSCYPTNSSNPASACFNCFTQSNLTAFKCEDGATLTPNAFTCVAQLCIPQRNGCSECEASGHQLYSIDGDLNKGSTTSIDPQLKYTIRILNQTNPVNILSSSLQPSCQVFLYPTGGPRMENCKSFSFASSAGIPLDACGLEYSATFDPAANAFVWESESSLALTASQIYQIVASCSMATGNTCNVRSTSNSFAVGGQGKCPNSVVNITDRLFTESGACFAGAPPYKCLISSNEPIVQDAVACGCPEGQVVNQSTNTCSGNKKLTAGAAYNVVFNPLFLFPLAIIAFFLSPMIYAYIRSRGGGRDFKNH